jgi:putative transcriptional regulator
MDDGSVGSETLTGKLLVAAPSLRGSTFDRAVVLMLSHDGDGALGVMVNKPTEVLVGDVLPRWMPVVSEPGVVVDLDTPAEIIEPAVTAMRVFAGYAGWAPDQLESEIDEGSWFVVDAEPGDAFRLDAQDMWSTVLRRQGGQLALIATFPADPSMN